MEVVFFGNRLTLWSISTAPNAFREHMKGKNHLQRMALKKVKKPFFRAPGADAQRSDSASSTCSLAMDGRMRLGHPLFPPCPHHNLHLWFHSAARQLATSQSQLKGRGLANLIFDCAAGLRRARACGCSRGHPEGGQFRQVS